MTTAEVNAVIAKAKGWVRYCDVAKFPYADPTRRPWKWVDAENEEFHDDPADDPRVWSRLLTEMMGDNARVVVETISGVFGVGWFPGNLSIKQGDTLGEAVCRAWLAWKDASNA